MFTAVDGLVITGFDQVAGWTPGSQSHFEDRGQYAKETHGLSSLYKWLADTLKLYKEARMAIERRTADIQAYNHAFAEEPRENNVYQEIW
jgi:hypothetical protein